MVQGYNVDVNGRRCAGAFVRVRARCLGAKVSHSLHGCETCEVNTRENEVVAAGLTTVCAWRELLPKTTRK